VFWYLITTEKNNLKLLLALSILFRLIFLFAIPNLSQDFYRFIWDGRMILEAINPYESLPETFIEKENYPINQAIDLYDGMGSLNGSHYTNYPPINQLSFVMAAIFAKTSILWSVVVMRLQIILADIGIIYIGKKILERLNIPLHHIFLYALNPFIIIELTGNLHFEAVMLFFLVWSLYLLLQKKWIWSAFIFGLSVSVKLIPLLFIPLFYQWFTKDEKRKGILNFFSFGAIIIGINMLLFLPFLSSNLLDNYLSSVGLWFQNFEFNASVYYIAREIGYLFRGWNEIAIIGKILPIITVVFIVVISFFRKNNSPQQLFTAMLLGLTFYYFMATTVHPWYIASLVLLSVFTKYKYPIVWSIVIILSYQAYANNPWQENLWLITLEYLMVYGFLFWEIIQLKKDSLSRE
jgi:Gpi18-like mannosyltransferase